jgi:hypothetical protein
LYREKCLGCHGATLARDHQLSTSDCVGCHMPSRGTIDGAHAAFTDHQIRRRPVKEELGRQPSSLVPWRAGPREYAQRNLGLAYLSAGAQQQSPAATIWCKALAGCCDNKQLLPEQGHGFLLSQAGYGKKPPRILPSRQAGMLREARDLRQDGVS